MKTDPDAPRITQQYRDRESRMVYELKHGTSRLVVLASESADGRAGWRFEAYFVSDSPLPVMGEWGKTRAAAFHSMRGLWAERGGTLGLAYVDWDAVAAALTAVRAI